MTQKKSKKGKDIRFKAGKGVFFHSFINKFIAHKLSNLTECNAHDASMFKEPWLNNFILNSAFIATIPEPDRTYYFNFLRRVEGAFIEYELARLALEDYVESKINHPEKNRVSPYFKAILHFEIFVAQMIQSLEFLRTLSGKDYFISGGGTIIEKFNTLYRSSKHMDRWIKQGRIPKNATVVIWITNQGLESKDVKLAFDEIYEALEDMAKFAKRISSLGKNQKENL